MRCATWPSGVRAFAAGLGGADIAAVFRRLDLIDEYRIYVHPVLIGRGRRLFESDEPSTDLRLVGTRTFVVTR